MGRPGGTGDVGGALRLRAKQGPMKKIAARLGCGVTTVRKALKDAEARSHEEQGSNGHTPQEPATAA